MKKIILSLLGLSIVGVTLAQTLSNSNLVITPSPIDPSILVAGVTVTNNTNFARNVVCERTVNNLAPGHVSHFCWDLCYGPLTNISGPVSIPANGSNTTYFVGDLETNGMPGTSDVTYSFYVEGNPGDATTVQISYFTTGINDITQSGKSQISSARPNPADQFTTMSYTLKADPSSYKLEIVNMIGSKVAEYSLQGKNGVMTLPTSNLNSGVYFYVLKENNKTISSQKLVVSHK